MSASSNGYNKITVVDENDEHPRAATFEEAVENGLVRRASRVFVFKSSNQLLVQRRGPHIAKPNLLDQSAAGHVDAGEEYHQAAVRELSEEVGIEGVELREVVLSLRTKSFFNAIYRCDVPSDIKLSIDETEVSEVIWFELDELEALMTSSPEEFNPDFLEAWQMVGDMIKVS